MSLWNLVGSAGRAHSFHLSARNKGVLVWHAFEQREERQGWFVVYLVALSAQWTLSKKMHLCCMYVGMLCTMYVCRVCMHACCLYVCMLYETGNNSKIITAIRDIHTSIHGEMMRPANLYYQVHNTQHTDWMMTTCVEYEWIDWADRRFGRSAESAESLQ